MENKSHVRELFSHTLIYGAGILLNRTVSFILLPVYTKYFSPEQIGVFILVQSVSLFLGIIYSLGMETSFIKFFIDSKDNKSKSEVYSSTLIFLSFSSLIFSIIVFCYSENIAVFFKFTDIPESKFLFKILSLLLFIDTLYRFPLLLFRAELKTKMYTYLNAITFVISILSNIIMIIILRMGVEAIFYCSIISFLITFLVGILLTKKYLTLKISFDKIKELVMYGNKFIYIGLFFILIDVSDRFFLKYFFDESIVGIYWANYRLATVMSLIIAAFRFSWTPYFLNLSENPDNKKIISSVFTYFIFAGLSLFLIFSIFMEQLVKISFFGFTLLDINYWGGLNIVPIILLAYFFSGLYSTLNAAPFFANKTYTILIITFTGLVINLTLNFILIPKMEMTGAALSTLLTYFIMFILIYFYSQRVYNIEFDWNKILKICFLSITTFVIGYFFINKLAIHTLIIIVLNMALIGIYLFVINNFGIISLKKISLLWEK